MLATIIATIIFILILVIGHEFGHFIMAKLMGATVTEFGFGFPPKIASKRFKGTEYSFNALPFGGFVSIYGESDPDAPKPEAEAGMPAAQFPRPGCMERALIVVAGIVMNLLIAWVVFSIVFMIGIPSTVVITAVQPNSPAASAGLEAGDQIFKFSTPDAFNSYIDNNLGHRFLSRWSVLARTSDITASPRANPPAGQGHIGIVIQNGGIPRENIFNALIDGAKFDVGSDCTDSRYVMGFAQGTVYGPLGRTFGGDRSGRNISRSSARPRSRACLICSICSV